MEPKVVRIEIKVTRTMAIVLAGLLVALALLAVPSAGAHPPLEGPGGQGGVTVASSVPTMISYQGQLLDSGGNPVPDGTYSMTFKLYDVPSGGTAFWEETHPNVQVTDGLFNVLLGVYIPFEPDDFTGTTYLGVTVESDPEMTPKQQIVSVGYAFRAEKAKSDDDWDGAGTGKMYPHYLTDNVGIGTTNPVAKLHVLDGDIRVEDNGSADTIRAYKQSAVGRAGHFEITNVSNPSSVLEANTLGTGPLLDLKKNGITKVRVTNDGNVGIGTTSPQSTLQIEGSPGYLQIDSYNGIPPASDCDSDDERGRMILDFASNRLYVCNGAARGWDYVELTN